MTATDHTEYSELRATIRERGTARVWVFMIGILGWAGIAVATAGPAAPPLGTLVPLVVLVAAFEAVYALHVGVERIGRYLQVAYESDNPGWEHAAMQFGRPKGAAAVDSLFVVPFVLAAALNLIPALLFEPTREEVIFLAGAHALFLLRVVVARGTARRQREVDLARFRQIEQPQKPQSSQR